MFGNLLRGAVLRTAFLGWPPECADETSGPSHARYRRYHPDAGGYVLSWGTPSDHAAWSVCIYFRRGRRRDVAKFLNPFTKKKINPMIGLCGISAISDEQLCGP